jgi:putative oxidoreductase
MARDLGLLFLRVTAGLMMAGHGFGKVSDLFAGKTDFPDPLGIGSTPSLILAAFGEFLCALLVVVGLKTRFSAIPVAITMLVAAFVFHAADPFEKKELALIYAIPFLALTLTGGGRFALDTLLDRKPKKKR